MFDRRAQHWGKDAVALVALIAAAGWTGWLLARQSFDLDATWTDGVNPIPSLAQEAVRHAIWDDPRTLGNQINVSDRAGRPAISPDGRLVVFSIGERGLNAELWVAEWDGEVALDPHPLTGVNSAADELAPAFGPDALWFASDRGGAEFGLDLWRVPYLEGRFGQPETVGAGINSSADDTDPFPVPGYEALVFSSNRARGARTDFDLFGAVAQTNPAAEAERDVGQNRTWIVGSLASLNSPFEEREPALTPDGRTLLFASDRGQARTGDRSGASRFDLYRSFRSRDDILEPWLDPTPLTGLNSAASERGPLPADGGFTLLFERSGETGPRELLRARSRELFRLPQPPLGLQDLLILIVLVALAVLALLAKRWHAIDVLYKCILISVLVHLALMLWFREVIPEAETFVAQDIERTFRVRLASEAPQPSAALQEQAGELNPERQPLDTESANPTREEVRADLASTEAALPEGREGLDAAAPAPQSSPQAERMLLSESSASRAQDSIAIVQPARLKAAFDAATPGLRLDMTAEQAQASDRARPATVDPSRALSAAKESPAIAASPIQAARTVTARASGNDTPTAPRRARMDEADARQLATHSSVVSVAKPATLAARPSQGAPALEVASLPAAGLSNERERSPQATPGLQTDSRPRDSALVAVEPSLTATLNSATEQPSSTASELERRERLDGPGQRSIESTGLEERRDPYGREGSSSDAGQTVPAALDLGTLAQRERPDKSSDGRSDRSPQRAQRTEGDPVLTAAEPSVATGHGPEAPQPNSLARDPQRRERLGEAGQRTLASTALEARGDPFEHGEATPSSKPGAPIGLDLGTLDRRDRPDTAPGSSPQRALSQRSQATLAAAEPSLTPNPHPATKQPDSSADELKRRGRLGGPTKRTFENTRLEAPGDSFESLGTATVAESDAPAELDLGTPTRREQRDKTPASSLQRAAAPTRGSASTRGAAELIERPLAPALVATRGNTSGSPLRPTHALSTQGNQQPAIEVRLPANDSAPAAANGANSVTTTNGASASLALQAQRPAPKRRDSRSAGPSPRRFGRSGSGNPSLSDVKPEQRPLVAALAPDQNPIDRTQRERERSAYSNRFGDAKLRALEEYGGGVETERAVADGLKYLASIQNSNGSWGDRRDFDREKYRDVRVGKTGLVLLAFLGAGHLPGGNTRYAGVTEAAVAYLVDLISERTGHVGNGSSYSHGIATYALAECFALTKDESLRAPLRRAIARILVAQDERRDPRLQGGWGYYFSDGAVWDNDRWPRVSVSVWQIMALESARLGGLRVPDQAFENARAFLANAWDGQRAAFRYNHDPVRLRSRYAVLPASTPAALFGLSLMGLDLESRDLQPAWDFINERRPDGYRFRGDDAFVLRGQGNLYFWYYGSLACFRRGGETWQRWNIAMQETLLPAQKQDGSWQPLSTYARYAGDDDAERTYTTALSVLTLEVYYRYFTPLLQVR